MAKKKFEKINGNSVCTGLMGKEMKPTQLENHLTKIYMTSMNMRKIAIYISRQKSLQILSNTYSKCLFTVSLFTEDECTHRHLIRIFSLAG